MSEEDGDSTAKALQDVALAIHRLGNADASTPMGGLEGLGAVHEKGVEALVAVFESMSSNIDDIATGINQIDDLEIAKAINRVADALHRIADNMP